MDECAYASLIATSFTDVPHVVCVDPNYLNWSTSSSTFPFIYLLVDGLSFTLLMSILLLSELISITFLGAIFSSLPGSS